MTGELARMETPMIPAETEPEPKGLVAVERYRGISQEPVSEEKARVLMAPIDDSDIEIRPDGMIYLPEIKYRRRLNQTFGPGGWALMPTSKFDMRDNTIMRQYAMYANGRFISEAVGEQEYIQNNPNMTYATAAEGCKSNALMRCCKDLGIASELWDPAFIAFWIPQHAIKIWNPKTSKYNWRRKDREAFFWEKKVDPQPQQDVPQTTNSAQPEYQRPSESPVCPKCANYSMKLIPSGTSKPKADGSGGGKPYPAFWICTQPGCKGTVRDKDFQTSKNKPAEQYAEGADPDPYLEREPGSEG